VLENSVASGVARRQQHPEINSNTNPEINSVTKGVARRQEQ
jgi:hypothetical protein